MYRFLFACAFASILWGCDAFSHEPSGANPVEVDPTVEPLVVDIRTGPDSLVVWDTITLRYGFPSERRLIEQVEIRFGDEVVATTTNLSEVTIATSVVPDGTYSVRVVGTVRTGTGSLADQLGFETVSGEGTRVVLVDNAPAQPSPVSYGVSADGELQVTWEPRDRPAFQGYRLYRLEGGNRRLIVETNDPDATSWSDPYFFSGEPSYAVDVRARDQTAMGTPTVKTFSAPWLAEEVRVGPDQLRLRWTAAAFPATFGGYEILQSGAGYASTVVATIDAISDTTTILDLPDVFGASLSYQLQTRTRPFSGVVSGGSTDDIARDPLLPIDSVVGAAQGAYIGLDGDDLVRVSPVDFSRLASFSLPQAQGATVRVSQSGLLGVFTVGSVFPFERNVTLLDGGSFAVLGSFVQSDAIGDRAQLSLNPLGSSILADDGTLLASYSEYWSPTTYANLGALAVDLATGTVRTRLDAVGTRPPGFNVNYQSVRLRGASPDGRFALLSLGFGSPELYEVVPDGTFQRLGAISLGQGLAFVSGDRVARLDNGRIHVLDLPSLTEQSSFPAPDLVGFGSYDAATGLLVGGAESDNGAGRVIGYDLATGAVAFDTDVVPSARYAAGLLTANGRYRRVAPLR